ncbi:MAG: agmatine deiminase family protein [Bryobacterales bacterium]|nr:agmatine deiminase family protein [Bryobacterales bacterium]
MGMNSCGHSPPETVQLLSVPASQNFPDAIAPGALRWACAPQLDELQSYFAAHHAPFEKELVKAEDGRLCHIDYEPAEPGFRAAPEDAPLQELFLNIDSLAFLSEREETVGDSLDIARQILPRVTHPLTVTLGVAPYPLDLYKPALAHFFPDSIHAFQFHQSPGEDYDPWIQDFLKSGESRGEKKILVTRQAFEGQAELAGSLRPLLDSFQGEEFVRSWLSWEGGDLQFARSPKDPRKLILFYGTSARQYWGGALTRQEFEYVLRREFGADEAIYLGDLTAHVDYLMTLLPAGHLALVAEPVCDDVDVARAAADMLLRQYSDPPPAELRNLHKALLESGAAATSDVREAMTQAEAAKRSWKTFADPGVTRRIKEYVAENCPRDARACIGEAGLPVLLDRHPGILKDWVTAGAKLRVGETFAGRLLMVIEGQVSDCRAPAPGALEEVIAQLREAGFNIARVPWIPGVGPPSPWAGLSYTNAALIGRTLFVPQLGLGHVEQSWFHHIRKALPETYDVIPVDAEFLLLRNGGIHCALAFGRALAEK